MQDNMKSNLDRQFARFGLLVSLLCVPCASVVNSAAQDFKTIHDGVEYAEVNRKLGDDPVKINLLRLDLTKVRLDVHHAMNAAIGTEKTSSIATRHGAVAAINAGFFRLDKSAFAGDTIGTLAIDSVLQSENVNGRITLLLASYKKVTSVLFGHFNSSISISTNDDTTPNSIKVSGINRELREEEIVLYTNFFGKPVSTNIAGVVGLSLSGCRNDHTKGAFELPFVACRSLETVNDSKEYAVPKGGFLLLIGTRAIERAQPLLKKSRALTGSKKKLRVGLFVKFWEGGNELLIDKETDMIAGVPQLIKNGKIDITWEQEKASKSFVETRHPRTAVAKLKDGKFLMITVDGRQPGVSVGMNLNELAEYLLGLGAVDAMNLDGGGSTTMFLDGKVVNHPSDKEGERKVSDAILVTLRKKK